MPIQQTEQMISLQKSFLFIHVPKTGGNSIQNILHPYSDDRIVTPAPHQDGVERFEIRNPDLRIRKHSTLSEYKAQLPRRVYRRLFKFATIRNPWDLMVSMYFSPHRNVSTWNEADFLDLLAETPTLRHYLGLPARSLPGFPKPRRAAPLDEQIDFLLRFEHLDRDFETLCGKIDIPFTPLPVRNPSSRDHYARYYTPALTEKVGEKFHEEIVLGGYKFETL